MEGRLCCRFKHPKAGLSHWQLCEALGIRLNLNGVLPFNIIGVAGGGCLHSAYKGLVVPQYLNGESVAHLQAVEICQWDNLKSMMDRLVHDAAATDQRFAAVVGKVTREDAVEGGFVAATTALSSLAIKASDLLEADELCAFTGRGSEHRLRGLTEVNKAAIGIKKTQIIHSIGRQYAVVWKNVTPA